MTNIRSRSACQGKVPYATRREAAADLRNKRRVGNVKPYRCGVCGLWHVGHVMPKSQAIRFQGARPK